VGEGVVEDGGLQVGVMRLTGHQTESAHRPNAIADTSAQEKELEKLARLFDGKKKARKTISHRNTAER